MVDELAGRIGTFKEKGIRHHFVYVKLSKFLPIWCREDKNASYESDSDDECDLRTIAEMHRIMNIAPKKRKVLTFLQWQAAFDVHSLAEEATKQISLSALLCYKAACLKIAYKSIPEKRRHGLAVMYAEAVRMSWASSSYNGEADFEVEHIARKIDADCLEFAREQWDKLDCERYYFTKGKSATKVKRRSAQKARCRTLLEKVS